MRSDRVVVLVLVMCLVACDGSTLGPGDSGVRYRIENQCGYTVRVEMASGSDQLTIDDGAIGSFRSLDESPDETFVITGPTGSTIDVSPRAASFRLVNDRCPK